MSETQSLWLVLALIYAIECLAWLPQRAVAFRTWLGRRYRLVQPVSWIANSRGGFVPVHPLPPFGTIYFSQPSPLTPWVSGVRDAAGRLLPWADLRPLRVVNKEIRLNDATVARCSSNAHAVALRADLLALAELKAGARAEGIAAWRQRSFDGAAIRDRLAQFQRASRPLRAWCVALWVFVFVGAPALVWWRGLLVTWWWILIGLFALTANIAFAYRRQHRRWYPAADEERFSYFLTFLLSPASAIRAVDGLSRSAAVTFHPLAVARAIGADADFRSLAAEWVRRARFPTHDVPGRLDEAESEESRGWVAFVEGWLRGEGFNPNDATQPPVRVDPGERAYCPRCHSQFTRIEGHCSECHGVRLLAFPGPTSPTGRR